MSSQLKEVGSIAGWWAGFTVLLWIGGQVRHASASLAVCAASAALLVALGETAQWLRLHVRRRCAARKASR